MVQWSPGKCRVMRCKMKVQINKVYSRCRRNGAVDKCSNSIS